MEDFIAVAFVLVSLFISAVMAFLPTIVAMFRGHRNVGAILVLNLFLGWTVLGWIGALVWSFTATGRNS